MVDDTELLSIFGRSQDKSLWLEYTVSIKTTAKMKHPYKLNATCAWRSSNSISCAAGVRGSYPTRDAALESVYHVIRDAGCEAQKMARQDFEYLKENFGYPSGRSQYLLSHPAA